MGRYIFDNAAEQATAQRFAGLETLFDGRTARFLAATGVGPGWQCLEVGGGSGSIAVWLADTVGESGRVLVTDIDTRFLATLADAGRPTVEVQRHDVGSDQLPEAAFDLIHARLVLIHVPTAPAALERLAAALKPGGWLVIEDFDPTFIDRTFPTANPVDAEAIGAAFRALGQLVIARGAGAHWGRSLYRRFVALGLEDVGMEGNIAIITGGSAGTRMDRANFSQIREAAVGGGLISAEGLDRAAALLDDPACAYASSTMFTAWGRRP